MMAPMPAARTSVWKAIGVLLAAALVPIVPFAVIGELPGERWLSLSSTDAFRFGLFGASLLALDVFLPIPSSIIGALLGGRLGFFPGFFWAFLGLCTGQALGYALGRLIPDRFASELPSAPTFALTFLSRPVPVLAEAVSIAAGVERVPFVRFALAGALGNACYAGALAADGDALLPQGLVGPGLIVPMLLPVLGFWLWRRLAPQR
jgi:membrane protein DedA with SNARE-associated domain